MLKSDYAKWMLEDPRVNFAISKRGVAPGLNHLGVQVESPEELAEMHERLKKLEQESVAEEAAACCYSVSDKYWSADPQGIEWETSVHAEDCVRVRAGRVRQREGGISLSDYKKRAGDCIDREDVATGR